MSRAADHRAALLARDPSTWPDYLDAHSGLPGPRADLELAQTVADLMTPELADALIASGDEYRTFCGILALGARAADPRVAERLRRHAVDERWRVREAVATALQRLGDRDLPALLAVVRSWTADPHPLVQRAAVAAICEPRLLRTPDAAAAAIEACRQTTAALLARSDRRDGDVRTLRQALGYCWSVAVAADPAPGLAAFGALDDPDRDPDPDTDPDTDPDVAWIVRSNRAKKRLSRLL